MVFVVGVFVGAILGVFCMCLAIVGSDRDDKHDE